MSEWTTKDGRTIAIKDMSDSHLLNSMKMLEKRHAFAIVDAELSFPMFQGEMAQLFAEQEWFAMQESTVEDMFPVYCDLFEEADKRGLV